MKAKQITLLISILYFLFGNLVGYGLYVNPTPEDGFLTYFFYPYTSIWGMSSMVGADWVTFVFILIVFLFSLALFFPLGMLFEKRSTKN